MDVSVEIDEELLAEVKLYTRLTDMNEIIREALRALIEREASQRMAEMGGSDPKAEAGSRRR